MKAETEETQWDERCAVCLKQVGAGEGMCHLKVGGAMIALCCPLCMETFEKDPATYLTRRLARRLAEQAKPPVGDWFSP